MITVQYATLARRDLERVHRYYLDIDPDIAVVLIEKIVAAIELLRTLPLAGPETTRMGRRKWRVAGTPYIVFYRAASRELRILRIVHGSKRSATP